MRQNPVVVFAGAIGALAVMTVLSVAIGWLVPTFMSKVVAHYAFIALFLFFGVRLIYDASACVSLTIALGAAKNAAGVTIGAVIGHALCSAVACVGGKMLASSISERTVAFSGGVLFIIFAVSTAYAGVD